MLTNFYNPAAGINVVPAFADGDRIRLQDIRTQVCNKRGTVIGIHPNRRSFEIDVDCVGTLIQNRRFVRC